MLFRVKICGITSADDARAAVDAGADAIGLNFYRDSVRFVNTQTARSIVDAIRDRACPVGVFVNAPVETICDACRGAEINTIQLHGDERPSFGRLITSLRDPSIRIIRAHGFGPRGMEAVYEDIFDEDSEAADAVLVDAAVSGMYGGTGRTIDWGRLVNYENSIGKVPLILAGGLTPENVAEAIRIVRPHAVDVASGVESSPGKKDVAKVRDFVAAANAAFAVI